MEAIQPPTPVPEGTAMTTTEIPPGMMTYDQAANVRQHERAERDEEADDLPDVAEG